MPRQDKSCENCDHAEFNSKPNNLEDRVKNEYLGECRIDQPKVMALPGPQGLAFFAPFPKVKPDCWCSKFVPKLGLRN